MTATARHGDPAGSNRLPARTEFRSKLILEELEPRIAPTTLTDGQGFTFGDSDDHDIVVSFRGAGQVVLFDTGGADLGSGADIGSIVFTGADLTTELVIVEVEIDTTAGTITAVPGGSEHFLATVNGTDIDSPSGSGGVLIDGNISAPGQNVGRILIDGTVRGTTSIGGSIEVLNVGFLAGTLNVGGDLGVFHVGTNLGLADGTFFLSTLSYSGSINVGGLIGHISYEANSFAYQITDGATAVPGFATRLFDGSNGAIVEAERVITDGLFGWAADLLGTTTINVGAVGSFLIRTNDTMATAQFVPGWDGAFTITGSVEGGLLDVDGDGVADSQDLVDWYAFPAMPGQVISFSATTRAAVGLYDPTGALVATTNNNVNSGTESFTVETPGIYYVAIGNGWDFTAPTGISGYLGYTITVDGSTPTHLGGLTGGASFASDVLLRTPTSFLPVGHPENWTELQPLGGMIFQGDIAWSYVFAGANALTDAGVVQISGASLGTINPLSPTISSIYDEIIISHGDVGRVTTTGNYYMGYIIVDGGITHDYDLQVVNIGTDAGYTAGGANVGISLIADGNIGTVNVGGTLFPTAPSGAVVPIVGPAGTIWYDDGGVIRANADNFGTPGAIDVLSIGADFGALSGGDPLIGTGLGGNVRFVTVGGTIYANGPLGASPILPITIAGGAGGSQPTFIADDSGGGMQVSVGAGTTLTYRYIPIRGVGPGVAITSMVVNGNSFSARVSGQVEVGEVNVTGVPIVDPITGLVTAPNFRFSPIDPSGETDIYHLSGDLGNFTNSTYDGDLVFGTIGNADSLVFNGPGGDIGITQYNTDAVIMPPGVGGVLNVRDQVPVRGVLATGNLPIVTAAGAIRDLMATGYLGTVRTNSDGVNTAAAQHAAGLIPDHVWDTAYAGRGDGAVGVIYGAGADPVNGLAIVDLDVGAGLGYAGSGMNANSGVFSPAVIGTVRATGVPSSFVDPAIIGSAGIRNVLGVNSASIWGGMIHAGDLDDWHKFNPSSVQSGIVGTVQVTGVGATITGTSISGLAVDRVIAQGDAVGPSNGINGIRVFSFGGGINLVQSDGPGILNSAFQAAGPIGNLVVTSLAGEFFNNSVQASTTLNLIQAPVIRDSLVDVFLSIRDIRAGTITEVPGQGFDAGDFIPASGRTLLSGTSFYCGGLNSVVATGDIERAYFNVAGPAGTVQSTGGTFDSFLLVTGPFGDVATLSAFGPLAGAVDVQGSVGTLTSLTGDLVGDMVIGGNVNLMSLPLGQIASDISIGGNLNGLRIAGDLGVPGGVFAVGGNLGRVTLGGRGIIADINSDLLVGGTMAGLTVSGELNGNLFVGGGISSLAFGGDVNTVAQHMAVSARIDYAGDVDFYSFDATAGQAITLATNTVGNGIAGLRVPDTVIGLYNAGGVLQTWNDDGGPGTDSLINFVIPADGTYYVAVANWPDGTGILQDLGTRFDGQPFGDTGPYTLTIDGTNAVGGAFEPRETRFFNLNNSVGAAQNLMGVAPFTAVGPVSRLTIGGRGVVADLNGDALFLGGVSSMTITGSFNSDMTVIGNLGSLSVATVAGGNLGVLGDTLAVTGSLGRLTVGGRDGAGVLNSDLIVGNGLGQMTVTGTVLGNIDVTGAAKSITVTGDLGLGPSVTHVNVTGSLSKLTVGGRGVASDLLSDLNVSGGLQNLAVSNDVLGDIDVGGELRSAKITGDVGMMFGTNHVNVGTNLRSMTIGARGILSTLFSDVNVGNDLGKLAAGPIWGDIVVTNNVQQVSTTSGVVPVAVPPPSYIFAFDNGLNPAGSLTAFGEVRQVRQLI